jgi:hypothetical protein
VTDELVTTAEEERSPVKVITEEQKRTRIYQHPARSKIEAMLKRGKSASWISLWLEEAYPLENAEGQPHPEHRENRRRRLTPSTIENYRRKFMPECVPGIDASSEELENIVGRAMPQPTSSRFELDVMEVGIRVAEKNLERALKQDDEMEMLQPQTIAAQTALMNSAEKTAMLKGKLGVPGYELVAEKSEITQHSTSRNMSLELHGRVGPNGEILPGEPDKMDVARKLIGMPREQAQATMAEISREVKARQENGDGPVEGQGTEIEDFDGGETRVQPGTA